MANRTLEDLQKRYNSYGSGNTGAPRGGMRGMMGGPGPRRGMPVMNTAKPKGQTRRIIGRIMTYVGAYKYLLLLALLFLLTSSLATAYASYLLRPIVNKIVEEGVDAATKFAYVVATVLKLLGIYCVAIAAQYLQSKIMLVVSNKSVEKLRDDLFEKVQRLPIRFFDNESHGEIMSRFTNDVDNVALMLDHTLTSLVSGALTLLTTLALMFRTSWQLSLVTVFFTPLFLKGSGFVAKYSRKYYSGQQAALGAVNGYIEESVSGQKVVKVFNHEDACNEEFAMLNDDLRHKQIKAQFYGGIMGPIMGNLGQISYAVTAGVGGVLCLVNGFDIGGLTIFVNYARQFSRPINEVSMQMSTVFSALAGAERVFNLLDRPEEIGDERDAKVLPVMQGNVRLDNVTFGYNKDKTILHHISLYAKPGQKIAFVGSTGAGKTTITNLLNRFYDIDEGAITIDGVNIKDIKLRELRKNIAMVLQDTHLFTGTIMENIRYGRPDATDEEVIAAAKTASAHSFIMRLSDGYDTVITGDGANLSQGQRQLLNIARAAISKAPILILDEATSSVDTRTERHIEHGMDRLMQDRTTFVIAHRLSTVRNANAIMVLEKGEIIERGTHDELLALGGRYYELYTGKTELD
ncbi:MAG: ABC transporter ATP-binding protein [Clostridia bacterium]|nr:ABC transporter ATP-binding protein [Clostridia bacterium]